MYPEREIPIKKSRDYVYEKMSLQSTQYDKTIRE